MSEGITSDQLADGVVVEFKVERTLTNAEIKALPTTPIVVKPATETLGYVGAPTQLFMPASAYATIDTSAGGYDEPDPTVFMTIGIGSDWSDDATERTNISNSFVLGWGGDLGKAMIPFIAPRTSVSVSGNQEVASVVPSVKRLTGNYQDNALVLACANGELGDFTGGNVANSMTVVVTYIVIPVP